MLKKAILAFLCLWAANLSFSHAQTFLKKFNSVKSFAKLGNMVIFAADDGTSGVELWKTDGTADGTVLVKDIAPGAASSNVSGCYLFNGKVYFSADDGLNGVELWRTDGTTQGTELVKDINPQKSMYSSSSPGNFKAVNGMLFFTASAGGAYSGLWKTDGTAAGTVKLIDDEYFGVGQLTAVGNKLYFTYAGNRSLWTSDGTVAGTKQIVVDDNYTVDELNSVNNELVFITNTSYRQNIKLYKLNPADNKAVLLKTYDAVTYGSLDIDNIIQVGTGFFFTIRTVDASDQGVDALWKSDSTPGGTSLVKSFSWKRYLSNSYMQNFISFNNKLYFAVTSSYAFWTSDGTDAGTMKVSDAQLAPGQLPVISNQKMYFVSNGLWGYDGTGSGKKELEQPAAPSSLFDAAGTLYFVWSKSPGVELWNNKPQPQIIVSRSYQTLDNGTTTTFMSTVDSAATSTVTIKNIGNKELTLSEISVTGSSFYVNGKLAQTILPGKQVSFNLLYYPVKEEQITGTLEIKSDNSNTGGFTAYLTGTATGTAKNRNAVPIDGLQKAIKFKDTLSLFSISANVIKEKDPVGTAIGTFAIADANGTFNYSLVTGAGDNDNSSFEIENGQLKNKKVFSFSAKNTYTLRVKATNGSDFFEKSFTVSVADVQENLAASACGQNIANLNYSLNDAVYLNTRLVAVGSRGTILTSDNDGQDWKLTPTGVSDDLAHIVVADEHTSYILGYNNTLLKTENGGDSWFSLVSPDATYPYLKGIYFYSAQVGYVFGENKLYKTIDGGKTWQKLAPNNYNALNAAWFTDENTGFICGSSQTLIRTKDGGKTWENITLASLGFNTNLNRIVFTNSKTGYITSSVGDVLQTQDGGNTWTRISTVGGDYVTGLYFVNNNEGYILSGFNSTGLFKTNDGGKTWAQESINARGAFMGLAINKSKDKLCLVGHGIGLGYTSEQGSCIYFKDSSGAWTSRSNIGNDNFYKLIFTDANSAYLFGSGSVRTTDAGLTWQPMNIPADSYNSIRSAVFIDKNIGFASNLNEVYKTTNAGATWDKIVTDKSSSISLVHFITADVGFYSTGAGLLYKTTDGGKSWKQLALNTSMGGLRYMQFLNQQTGYLLPLGGKIYKTTNAGETWLPLEVGSGYFLLCAYFINEQIGFVGGTNGALLRTTDGGQTWAPATLGYTSLGFASFAFVDDSHGYAITNYSNSGSSEIYETYDTGLTWKKVYTTSDGLFNLAAVNGKVYVSGDSGILLQIGAKQPSANAGYITGDIKVAAGVKYLYGVPSVSGTYYNWSASGPANIEYRNNTVSVQWTQGGKYVLQASPYNSCSTAESRTIEVEVLDMPEPVISGPETVFSQSANIEYTTTNRNNTYTWAASGSTNILPDKNKIKVSWGNIGTGKVTVVEYNQDLAIKKSATMDITIKAPDNLPANNFKVAVTSSSCKGSNNGMISVTAGKNYNYLAVVTGPNNYNKSFSFTTELKIPDLNIGSYNVCIGIDGNTSSSKCYTVNVTEPKDLAVYSFVEQTTQTLKLNLSGAETYFIQLNDKHYQTNTSQFDVKLSDGVNNLKVFTDKECQGTFEKKINVNSIVMYPNPVVDVLHIDLAGSNAKSASIEIRNLSGRIIYTKNYTTDMKAVLDVNMETLETGVYMLKLTLNSSEYVYKVIKK